MPARALCVERRACAADAHEIDGASRRGRGAAARSTCCLRSALARRVRLLRARLAVPGGSRHSEPEARPLGAQPPPRVLEPAASKAADSTALDHLGAARGAPARACGRRGVLGLYLAQKRQPRGRACPGLLLSGLGLLLQGYPSPVEDLDADACPALWCPALWLNRPGGAALRERADQQP